MYHENWCRCDRKTPRDLSKPRSGPYSNSYSNNLLRNTRSPKFRKCIQRFLGREAGGIAVTLLSWVAGAAIVKQLNYGIVLVGDDQA